MLKWIYRLVGRFTGERYERGQEKITGRRDFYADMYRADAKRKNPWA